MGAWREIRIAELARGGSSGVAGGPFGSSLGRKHYVPAGVPVIRGAQLAGNGRFSLDGLVFVSGEKADGHAGNLAHPGDLIVTQRGTLGQIGLIPSGQPYERFLLSQSQMKVSVDPTLADSEFLYFALSAPAAKQRLIDHAMTAGVPHVNLATLRDFQVFVPDVRTQRRIAAVLSAFDELIELNERRIELLEDLARSLYREWFVHFRFPGHKDVELVDSELGPIPDGWRVRALGAVTVNFDRCRKPLSKVNRAERPGPYPYYGAAKLIDFVDQWLFEGEYLLFAEDGTVQTPGGFPVLQLVEGRFWANNHTHILQGDGVSTRYLYVALARQPIVGYVTGAAQPKITQANLKRIPILIGSGGVHTAFDRVLGPVFDQWHATRTAIDQLAATRDFLLPRLVTGRLDISEIDLGILTPAKVE